VRAQIDASATPHLPLHITEWSASYSPRDPVHDSYTSAAFVLDKLKHTEGAAASMSYWTYSDLFEENGPPPAAFHGGFGLLTRDGVRKPAYFAYKYLNELGPTELVDDDSSSWLTRDGANLKLLVWNFSSLPQNEGDKAFFRKLHPAVPLQPLQVRITEVPPGEYTLELHRTGYRENDAYSAYIDMGLPKDLTTAQLQQLRGLTDDRSEASAVTVGADGIFTKTVPLRQNDVVLLSLLRRTKD
jgi:xylan 1,4-beta-xylosidase